MLQLATMMALSGNSPYSERIKKEPKKQLTEDSIAKQKGLKNPPIDSGISGGGSAPRTRVSDVMRQYAQRFRALRSLGISSTKAHLKNKI